MRVGDDRGVSLMEILMVVVAVAVMAGMAMPSLLGTMERYRLRAAAWELAGDLRLARQKAVSLQQSHRICLANCCSAVPAGGYLLERRDTGEPCGWKQDLTRSDLPDGLNLTFSVDKVIYNAKGEASGSTVTLTNSVGIFEVVAAPSGRVRACKVACPP
ncbi:MAG: GspH/FimT family pseudopilin [candidate division NC10 bacterium]|nr:GspH/FimT family pseudopilin [candidate division NC10 bacterium]